MADSITATNPQTGEKVRWNGSAWVPAGMGREALAANLESIDPRLAGAARVDDRAAAFAGATPLMLPAALAAKAVAAPAAAVLKFAGTPAGGAVIGGLEGAQRGPIEAAEGAVVGAAGGPLARGAIGKAGKLLEFLGRFKGTAPAIASTAAKGAVAAAPATEDAAMAAVGAKLPISQEEASILLQLRGAMDTSAGRLAAKQAVKEVFPNNWQEAWKFLTAPHTRIK